MRKCLEDIINISKLVKTIKDEFAEINLLDSSKNIGKCDVLFFCHDDNRGLVLNKKTYSPLIDSLGQYFEHIGLKCQTIAKPWSRLVGRAAFGNTHAINRVYLYSLMLHRLMRTAKKWSNIESPLTTFYENIITKSSPKFIISIGAPAFLSEAARRQRVIHFEILHGYGYCTLPFGWDALPKKYLPQGVLSMDAVSTATFSKLAKYNILIWQIENPFYSAFIQNLIKKQCFLYSGENEKKVSSRFRRNILILLQWGYENNKDGLPELNNILQNGILYDEIISLIIESPRDLYFKIRLHPVQLGSIKRRREIVAFLNSRLSEYDNWDCDYSSEAPLWQVASDCDGGMTMFSSSAYELAAMGIQTLVLCPTLMINGFQEAVFNDLEEEGYVKKMSIDNENFRDWIYSVTRKHPWKSRGKSLNIDELKDNLLLSSLGDRNA
ncbi:MAG: hypothetical protein ACI8VC_001798 [Candidatus Endobugula sp.]|jgi:hypothetical protein